MKVGFKSEGTAVPQAQTGKKRDNTYDWVRLIAMIFVVIGHSAYLNIQTTYGGVAYELPKDISSAYYSWPLSLLRELSGWVYGFHMPLFFMLSGAVFALKPIADADSLIKKKFQRLIVPYFVYGWLFMLPLKYAAGFYTSENFTKALGGFLSGEDSGHLWFLTALFWAMLVYAAIVKILQRLHVKSDYIVLFICGFIGYFYDSLPFDFLGIKTGLSYIFWFALGCVFQKVFIVKDNIKAWSRTRKAVLLAVLLVLELLNKKFYILDKNFTILAGSLLTYVLADFACLIFSSVNEKKGWKFLIRNLFYVYIFHDPLEYLALKFFMEKGLLCRAAGCYLYALTRTVLIFAASLLLGELVTRIKKAAVGHPGNKLGMGRIRE